MNRNLLLLLGGGAVLLWYLDSQKKPAAGTAPGVPAPVVAVQATPLLASAQPVATSAIRSKIETAITAAGNSTTFIYGQQSPDVWGWHAMQALPGWTAPSPEQLYPGVPDAHKPVLFNDWFTRVAQYLPGGLSGFQPRSPMFSRVYGGWMA